jgi:hypothetical protein
MKRPTKIKILLAIIVITIVIYFLLRACNDSDVPNAEQPHAGIPNPTVENFINSIDSLPNDYVCSQLYMNCMAAIDNIYPFAAGNSERWRYIVKLNGEYAGKICAQAEQYFNNGNCDIQELTCLKARLNDLHKSGVFNDPNQGMYQKLEQISLKIQQFETVESLIANGNKFNFAGTYDISDTFPIATVEQILSAIDSFEKISIISRCQRLTIAINSLRNNLFQKHIAYLEKKINSNGELYKQMNKSLYRDDVYNVLVDEIQNLDNNIYKVDSGVFSQIQGKLSSLNACYALNAYYYPNPPQTNCK